MITGGNMGFKKYLIAAGTALSLNAVEGGTLIELDESRITLC